MADELAAAMFRTAKDIRRLERARMENLRQAKQRKREIQENIELTDGQKQVALDKLQQESLERHRRFNADITKLMERGAEQRRRLHGLPVDEAKQAQVQRLLDKGHTVDQILTRARQYGDAEIVEALLTEMRWFGDKHGFADTADAIAACEDAIAQMDGGELGDRYEAATRITKATKSIPAVREYSAKAAMGADTPRDLLTVAYAAADARRGEEDDDDA